MQRQAHHPAAILRGFPIKDVKAILHLLHPVGLGLEIFIRDDPVIGLISHRHGKQFAVCRAHPIGKVVIGPVEAEPHAVLRQNIRRVEPLRPAGGKPAFNALATFLPQERQRLRDNLVLRLRLQPGVMDLAHVESMGDHFVPAGHDRLHHGGIALRDDAVDGETRTQTFLAEQAQNAEDADPIAIVAIGVIAEVR